MSNTEDQPQTTALLSLFTPPPNLSQDMEDDADGEPETMITGAHSPKPTLTPKSPSIPISSDNQVISDETRDATSALQETDSTSPQLPGAVFSPSDSYWNAKDSQNGSTSHLMSLFATGPKMTISAPSASISRPSMERQSTAPRSNLKVDDSTSQENTPLIGATASSSKVPTYSLDTLSNGWRNSTLPPTPSIKSGDHDVLPTYQQSSTSPPKVPVKRLSATGTMPSIQEAVGANNKRNDSWWTALSCFTHEATKATTWIGSFMYLLYHIVFCLALGSAIIRPNNPTSVLGLMCKMAALGSIASSFIYWLTLASEVPALYPTVDLFLAPFLANLAVIVDQTLANDPNVTEEDNDTIFLGTFAILSAIGICFSGLLLVLSSFFKLANLGTFLPFPVICGFFAAVGILTWTLAIAVDTGGKSVGTILSSGDMELIGYALVHHIPGVMIAVVMKFLGPRNPFYVIMIVICSVGIFYAAMFAMGVSLEEAKDNGWFWSHDELVYESTVPIGFSAWAPPAPFGSLNLLFHGRIHWGAIYNGFSTAIAMGFLYVIRCSVHGTALKKNIANLSRADKSNDQTTATTSFPSPKLPPMRPKPVKSRTFSEAVDIETVMNAPSSAQEQTQKVIKAKPTNITLNHILLPYGYNQFVAALVGGFPITPSVAASNTMFNLGAEGLAPQIGSILLLLIFYLTDFQLVGYIPKPAFSSMLVLAFIDMIYTWFYKSYFKTKDKLEWLVVPIIVVAAFVLDLLAAVFLGIAISTFLFVASFFRSGVVKYAANGITIHSTIERPFNSSEWLNQNGDLIQVLVLQNYLFFGNATSVYNYIEALFNDNTESRRPQFMILDMTLVTGLDTSTVDIFNDIKNLCSSNSCKLLMAGIPSAIRTIFGLGGFKADATGERSKRQVRFFASLDTALGKAEDILLDANFHQEENVVPYGHRRLLSEGDNGLRSALRQIDEQHKENFAVDLLPLQLFTRLIELQSGDRLYAYTDSLGDIERGLFFIESGVMKVEHSTDATVTRGTLRGSTVTGSIGALAPNNRLSGSFDPSQNQPTFRLARIGPGWVAGTLEYVSGIRHAGDHVAITDCRLHHLPYSKLQEIEKENPSLVLSLYKLLSFLMARRQEATIGQLATLHSIMTSPAKVHSLRRRLPGEK